MPRMTPSEAFVETMVANDVTAPVRWISEQMPLAEMLGLGISSRPEMAAHQSMAAAMLARVSELAEIPEKYGVTNVYGEVGSSFGSACINHPRHAAAPAAHRRVHHPVGRR